MNEIGFDGGDLRVSRKLAEKRRAHRDQRRGAVGSEIDPTKQFLAQWLGGVMKLGGGGR